MGTRLTGVNPSPAPEPMVLPFKSCPKHTIFHEISCAKVPPPTSTEPAKLFVGGAGAGILGGARGAVGLGTVKVAVPDSPDSRVKGPLLMPFP